MTGRAVPEWIGKTPDTPAPPRVKLRVFERYGGQCHITGLKIRPGDEWDTDHIKPLFEGGENREGNLAPALKAPHRKKTAAEMARKAKADRLRKKHLGVYDSGSRKLPGGRDDAWKRTINNGVVPRW